MKGLIKGGSALVLCIMAYHMFAGTADRFDMAIGGLACISCALGDALYALKSLELSLFKIASKLEATRSDA